MKQLVVRVHQLVEESVWQARYGEINDFERALTRAGVTLRKFFLHISRQEQHKRFERRLKDPRRHWKFSPLDLKEREHWDVYQAAYHDVLTRCSTEWAPWTVVPADHKWYRNLVVARAVVDTLDGMHLRFPEVPHGEAAV